LTGWVALRPEIRNGRLCRIPCKHRAGAIAASLLAALLAAATGDPIRFSSMAMAGRCRAHCEIAAAVARTCTAGARLGIA
jgi:hypothetical protein